MTEKRNLWAEQLSLFCDIWFERYGKVYYPTPADRGQLGRLLQSLPREALPELEVAFREYLNDMSPFLTHSIRHTLAYFCTSGGFNKYRSSGAVVSDREALSAKAVQQFVKGSKKK